MSLATAFDELPALLWRYDDYFARLTMSKRLKYSFNCFVTLFITLTFSFAKK